MRLYFGERSPISTLRMRSPSGLSDVKAREAPHRDVLLQLGDVLRNVLLNGQARLAEVGLLHEAALLEEVLHLAVDDLRDDLRRLPVLLRFRLVEVPLVDKHLVWDVLARNPARLISRHLKRELLGQLPEL